MKNKDVEIRRHQSLTSRKKEEWRENKIFNLYYHNTQSIKPYIILKKEVFYKAFKNNQIIVISFNSRNDIKLIFKITDDNYLEQTRKTVTIHKNIVDLIIKKYNFNPNKEEIKINKENNENFGLSEIHIELKEYIPRNELLFLTLNMLNDCVLTGQEIYNKDKKVIGVVNKLSNDSLTGLVNSETNIKLTSLTSDIYLIFDISKSSYNYNSNFYLNYEVIIYYVKNLLLKLKSRTTYHNIHLFFYARIFFNGKEEYNKRYKFVRKVNNETNKYYFDIYDKIEMFNAEQIDIKEITYKMNRIYQNYLNIKNEKDQKRSFRNLNEFFFSIRNNLQSPLEEKEKECLNFYGNFLSYTFEGYESPKNGRECSALDNNIFEEITEFELSSFNNVGVFESLIFAIGQIENNKKNNKNKKYSPLINLVLSGECFPYYSRTLADKVRSSIYEEYINLIFTYLCPKTKVSILSNQHNDDKRNTNIINNDQYYEINNFDGNMPSWCKVYYIPYSLLYKNIQKYKKQYKISLLRKDNNNLDEFHELHKDFDEKFSLDIINLNFKKENILDENNNNNEAQIKDSINNKNKKKLSLEDIIQRYSIQKPSVENNQDKIDKRNSESLEEKLRNNLSTDRELNLSWQYNGRIKDNDDENNEIIDISQNKLFTPIELTSKSGLKNLGNTDNEMDILENIFTNVPIPYFVEYAKDLRIDPKIIKCYVVKNNIELILKRIDHNFNIIVYNDKDEVMESIKNMINKKSINCFHEKFLLTNRKIMHILEFKANQVEILQYNIMRKSLYFQYYYLIANSINGSVFERTNIRSKKINWQEKDNCIKKEKKINKIKI